METVLRNPAPAFFAEARRSFHVALLENVLRANNAGVPSNADGNSPASIAVAKGILNRLGAEATGARLAGQMSSNQFEAITCKFINQTFPHLMHLRPGNWDIQQVTRRDRAALARFEQYSHLIALDKAARKNPELAAALGNRFMILSDIVVIRGPESDEQTNAAGLIVDEHVSRFASLRATNGGLPLLHATISCKWVIRKHHAQNTRSEALNLIRNRKGRAPHIAVVTAEPLPRRLASIALGTGDVDCVYHFALPELMMSVDKLGLEDPIRLVKIMVDGKRLKDIADLPLDLAV